MDTRRNAASSRHTFIFIITQSARSWNKFLMKRYQSEKSLESPTFSRPHACCFNCCWNRWRNDFYFHCHESRRIYICLCNVFDRAMSFSPEISLRWLCAHKFRKTTFSHSFVLSIGWGGKQIELAHFCHRRCRLKVFSVFSSFADVIWIVICL